MDGFVRHVIYSLPSSSTCASRRLARCSGPRYRGWPALEPSCALRAARLTASCTSQPSPSNVWTMFRCVSHLMHRLGTPVTGGSHQHSMCMRADVGHKHAAAGVSILPGCCVILQTCLQDFVQSWSRNGGAVPGIQHQPKTSLFSLSGNLVELHWGQQDQAASCLPAHTVIWTHCKLPQKSWALAQHSQSDIGLAGRHMKQQPHMYLHHQSLLDPVPYWCGTMAAGCV